MLHIDAKDQGHLFKNGYTEKAKGGRKGGKIGGRDIKWTKEKKKKEIKYSTLGHWLNTLYKSIHPLKYYSSMKIVECRYTF